MRKVYLQLKHLPLAVLRKARVLLLRRGEWGKSPLIKRGGSRRYVGRRGVLFLSLSILLAAGLISFFLLKGNGAAAWYSDSWGHRKKITIDADQVSGTQALQDFPVMISLTSDTHLSSNAQADGDDIFFTDTNGKKLNHEIESYAAGTLVAWVQVQNLSATTDTDIYMYYGNSSVSSQENVNPVWEKYQSVWHLAETATDEGTSTSYIDSTDGGINGTQAGPASGTGKTNGGQVFDGTDDRIDMTDTDRHSFGNSSTNSPFSISAWVNMTDATQSVIASKVPTNSYTGAEYLFFTNAFNQLGLTLYDGSSALTIGARTATIVAYEGQWIHVVATYDGTTTGDGIQIYINGQPQSMTAYSSGTSFEAMDNTTNPVRIGSSAHASGILGVFLNGSIDEVKIDNEVTSADWIATEYANQNSPATFFSVSDQETRTQGPVAYWKLDEGTGTSVNDSSGNRYTGTLGTGSSAPSWKSDEFCVSGKCLQFDGSTDTLTMTSADLNGSSFTVQYWIKPTTCTDFNQVLGAGNGWGAFLMHTNSTCQFYIGVDDISSARFEPDDIDTTLDLNQWQHISFTYDYQGSDSNPSVFYKNGTAYASANLADANEAWNGFEISEAVHGFVDEVKIYPYARTADEVKADFASASSSRGSSAVLGAEEQSFLSDGLVGYWDMEGIGSTATAQSVTDRSGNGNTGTTDDGANNTGMNCTTAGKYGGGCDFDGSDDFVDLNSPASLNTQYITIAAWINTDDTSGPGRTIYGRDNTGSGTVSLQKRGPNPDNWRFALRFEGNEGTSQTIDSDAGAVTGWVHLVATYDGKTMRMYVNNVLQANTLSISGTIDTDNFSEATIGDDWDGKIDEVRVYNRALSADEVRGLYQWAPGPLAYYSLDQGSGTTTANDTSGNGNNGTLSGKEENDWVTGKMGSALDFEADGDYLNTGISANYGQITLSSWIKLRSYGQSNLGRIFEKRTSSAERQLLGVTSSSSGRVQFIQEFSTTKGNWATPSSSIPLNQWLHVAVAYDSSSTSNDPNIYINGVKQTLTEINTPAGTLLTNADPYIVGNRGPNNTDRTFDGYIDEVRIYNYVRTPAQIIEDMNGSHPAVGTPVGSTVLHLSFDEGYSTIANDKSPLKNAFTLSSASWTNDGKFGKAWNGTGSVWMSRGDDSDLDFDEISDFTVTTWFKRNTVSAAEVILQKFESSGADGGYRIQMESDGDISFGIDDDNSSFPEDSVTSTAATYDDNSWHHLAAVKTGITSMRLYIDAKEVGTADTSLSATGTLVNNDTMYIGDSNGSNGTDEFAGQLDELKIYPFALTAAQVATDYNGGKTLVFGAGNTGVGGTAVSSAGSRDYCVPGDATSCNGPMIEMKFEDKSGTTYYDTSSNGRNGTATGTPLQQASAHCASGRCLDFDGSDDYIAIDSGYVGSSSTFTITSWVKVKLPLSAEASIYTEGRSNSNSDGISFGINADGTANIAIRPNGVGSWTYVSGTTSIADGEWHYVSVVQESTTSRKIYIDGALDATSTTSIAALTAPSQNTIGVLRRNGLLHNYFNGSVDQLRTYNYVRTPAQIAWDYNKGAPVAHYKFDECQGTTAYDASGNGNNGTITIGGGLEDTVGNCSTSSTAWGSGSTGKFQASLDFDGSDDYVDVGSIGTGTTINSVSLWVKPASTTASVMDIDGGTHTITIASGTVTATGWSSPTIYVNGKASTAATASAWNHIVITTATGFAASNVDIGRVSSSYFDGQIDDVRIYTYPLTATQVRDVYNGGAVSFR